MRGRFRRIDAGTVAAVRSSREECPSVPSMSPTSQVSGPMCRCGNVSVGARSVAALGLVGEHPHPEPHPPEGAEPLEGDGTTTGDEAALVEFIGFFTARWEAE